MADLDPLQYAAVVVVARSSDVTVSSHQVLAKLIAQFGGRGGGKGELAQGGGLDAQPGKLQRRPVLGNGELV